MQIQHPYQPTESNRYFDYSAFQIKAQMTALHVIPTKTLQLLSGRIVENRHPGMKRNNVSYA